MLDPTFLLTVLVVLFSVAVAVLIAYLFSGSRLRNEHKLIAYILYLIAAPILIYQVLLLPLTPVVLVPMWTLSLVVAWGFAVQRTISQLSGGKSVVFILAFLVLYGGLGYHVYQLLEAQRQAGTRPTKTRQHASTPPKSTAKKVK